MGTHFNSADVFPDASRFVGVGSYEGAHCVLIYDYDSFSLSSHQALQPLTVGDEIIFTARIKCVDDSLVAVASDGCLLVHDVAANRTITAKRGRYCSTSLLVHSSLIMCPVRGDTESSSKASIVVWKCPTLERLLEVPVGQYTPFSHCVCPSQDGFLLFTGLSRSTIFANNLDTGEKVAELKPRTSLDSGPQVYYMIQGWRVLFAASSTTITLYNIGEWNERQTLRKHDQNVNCIAIHRDRLFTGGHDKLIIVWGLY
jgi:WD40 repeat protein